MKHKILAMIVGIVLIVGMASMTGCGNGSSGDPAEGSASSDPLKVTCNNGVMVGQEEEDEVISFLGVPYAEPPVGDLRWKAPVAAADSDEEIECKEFGLTALQYEWPTEQASYSEKGEDCLSLNIWSSTKQTDEPKSVMVWFHGGSHAWGGTTDPIYNGHNFVKENPDVILVTCNYRLGLMAWPDFTQIPGGEEYTDFNLGIRDHICALEWIRNNIKGFGGNPENVTIYGESAGGTSVGALLVSPMAEGLFQNAIIESGGLPSGNREEAQEFANYICKVSGAKTMDDLLAIDEDKWMELDTEYWIGDESCGTICDGEVIPYEKDMDEALANAAKRGVNLMLGANADEWNYFKADMEGDTDEEKFQAWYKGVNKMWKQYDTDENKADMKKLYSALEKRVERDLGEYTSDPEVKDALVKSSFRTECWRQRHIDIAETFSEAGGKAYLYDWTVPSTKDEYYKSACHAVELAYVFNNPQDDIYSGECDMETVQTAIKVWSTFAKAGNPSIEGVDWAAFDIKDRSTMMIALDGWKTQSDPTKEIRELIVKVGGKMD